MHRKQERRNPGDPWTESNPPQPAESRGSSQTVKQHIDDVETAGGSIGEGIVDGKGRQQQRPIHGALRIDGERPGAVKERWDPRQVADMRIEDDGVKIVEMKAIAETTSVEDGNQ